MNVQNISFSASTENATFSNFTNKKEQLKNNAAKQAEVPSYTREAVKFGVAFPLTFVTGKMVYSYIKAKITGKNYHEVYGKNLLERFGEETAKATKKAKTKNLKILAGVTLKSLKGIIGLTAVGIGTGLLMKNQMEKNPDNKVLRGIDKAATILGI